MKGRPKINLELSATDKLLEFFAWVLLIGTWGFSISNYAKLPDLIPVHFNAAGQADRFGAKATILTLPIVSSLLFAGLTILNKFPHIFNYPTKINQENAVKHYTYATRLLRYLKLLFVAILGFINLRTIQIAKGQADSLGVWLFPLMLGFIFIPLIFFISKSKKIK